MSPPTQPGDDADALAVLVGALPAEVLDVDAVIGGDICASYRVRTDSGTTVFAKVWRAAPEEFFAAEAAGLEWLRAGGALTPAVLSVSSAGLCLEWLPHAAPSAAAAAALGASLAGQHRSGAAGFGSVAAGVERSWTGRLGFPVRVSDNPAEYLGARLHHAASAAELSAGGRRTIDALCEALPSLLGPGEAAARLHGDLWSGNLVWGERTVSLVDPTAQGGLRETDLAMLALFGCPLLATVLESYDAHFPLPEGWRERIALHQIQPLLVHAALFGGSYGPRAVGLAASYLQGRPG